MLHFKRESSELILIEFEGETLGKFTLIEGQWLCSLNQPLKRNAFEEILLRMQKLHSWEPPFFRSKDGTITVSTATGALRRAEFPVGEFVRVERIDADNTCAIITQTKEEGIRRIITLNSKEDIEGAVRYGKKRISTKGTHADPG